MKKSIGSILGLCLSLSIVFPVAAKTSKIEISNNGSKSINSVKTRSSVKKQTSQSNVFVTNNQIQVKSNTGSNKVKDNTGGSTQTVTGNINSTVVVGNMGGFNYMSSDTCCGWDCEDPVCVEQPGWAEDFMNVNQGTLKDNSPIVDPQRINPQAVTGAADGDFFSLGKGGSITVRFDQPVKNVAGVDLSFHEVTQDRGTYPEEKMIVEVSQNGVAWFNIGQVSNNDGGDGVGYLDFNATGLSSISYVRLTDSTDFSIHDDQADGYDLDAVDATLLSCELISQN